MAYTSSSSVTDQINQRVEKLANLLDAQADNIQAMKAIGVQLDIPMGVRQRLIQLYGQKARNWLAEFEVQESATPSIKAQPGALVSSYEQLYASQRLG